MDVVKAKKAKTAAQIKAAPAAARPLMNQSRISHARISQKAYELYERRGCMHGQDWEDWFEAEKMLIR